MSLLKSDCTLSGTDPLTDLASKLGPSNHHHSSDFHPVISSPHHQPPPAPQDTRHVHLRRRRNAIDINADYERYFSVTGNLHNPLSPPFSPGSAESASVAPSVNWNTLAWPCE